MTTNVSNHIKEFLCPHGHPSCTPLESQDLLLQGSPVAMFVLDNQGVVRYWNKACEHTTGIPAHEVINTKNQWKGFYTQPRAVLADLVLIDSLDQALKTYKSNSIRKSSVIPGAYEAEGFFPKLGATGKWLYFTAAQLVDHNGQVLGAIETLQDITGEKNAELALKKEHEQLEKLVAQRTAELTTKNEELVELVNERSKLEESVSFVSNTAMTAMTSMGEMGQLLQIIQRMYACDSFEDICSVVISGLTEYGLEGAIQIRSPGETCGLATDGVVTPHDVAVIHRLSAMGRIVQFHSRMVINFEQVSVLLRNVPKEDPDKAGRIRDNIAILVEAANVRTSAFIAVQESDTHRSTISFASLKIRDTLELAAEKQALALEKSANALNSMLAKIERRYLSLGLSNSQEEELTELIKLSVEEILDVQSGQYELLEQLKSVSATLNVTYS